MSSLGLPPLVFPFCAVLYNERHTHKNSINEKLEALFKGSEAYSFGEGRYDLNAYYQNEMGNQKDLNRYWRVYPQLIERENLVHWKSFCHELEQSHLQDGGGRIFNLDPGYISLEQMVLATGKPYAHRLYLGQSVYGELTYLFQNKEWRPLPWTYPDYLLEPVKEEFFKARKTLQNHLRTNS